MRVAGRYRPERASVAPFRLEESRGIGPAIARRAFFPLVLGLPGAVFPQSPARWLPGLQLYTVREPLAADIDATLRGIAEIGYREVETAGFAAAAIDVLQEKLKRFGLAVPAMHAGYDDLRRDPGSVVAEAAILGSTFAVCPSVDADQRRTADDWKRVCETLTRAGRALRRNGVTLAYHNHDFEFVPFDDGTTPFQSILGETDPDDVKLELDVYWLAKAGRDPVKSLLAARGRAALVHLKDLGRDGSTMELGAGVLDLESIVRAALLVGVKHLFVEQDDSSDPMRSAATSLRFLERLPPDVRPLSRP